MLCRMRQWLWCRSRQCKAVAVRGDGRRSGMSSLGFGDFEEPLDLFACRYQANGRTGGDRERGMCRQQIVLAQGLLSWRLTDVNVLFGRRDAVVHKMPADGRLAISCGRLDCCQLLLNHRRKFIIVNESCGLETQPMVAICCCLLFVYKKVSRDKERKLPPSEKIEALALVGRVS
jgi:hypothetical protein